MIWVDEIYLGTYLYIHFLWICGATGPETSGLKNIIFQNLLQLNFDILDLDQSPIILPLGGSLPDQRTQ